MFNLEDAQIIAAAIHRVGNKSEDEGCVFSRQELLLDDSLKQILANYFLTPFKSEEYHNFFHETDLEMNEVYAYASRIFDNPDNLFEESVHIAKHLYDKSEHPNIKAGDFYTVYFEDCYVDGETVEAIGLFKSENKDTFLRVSNEGGEFQLESLLGINIKKLDNGCLIFNKERENGYLVSAIDNTNRSSEAQYWMDDFLHIRQREDEYFHTQNIMALTKNFVMRELPEQFEDVTKAEQAAILNDSIKFFKEKDNFTIEEFNQEVIQQPEIIQHFQDYKEKFAADNQIEFPESFDISESAVKKQARGFRSVIKLDKNFHIYVHGNQNLLEQGEDEKGKFYKVYYKEES